MIYVLVPFNFQVFSYLISWLILTVWFCLNLFAGFSLRMFSMVFQYLLLDLFAVFQAKNLADQFNLDQLLEATCFTGTRPRPLWSVVVLDLQNLWYIDDFRMTPEADVLFEKLESYHISYIIYHISYIIYHISYIISYIISYPLDSKRTKDTARQIFGSEFWSAGLEALLLGQIRGLRALHAIVGGGHDVYTWQKAKNKDRKRIERGIIWHNSVCHRWICIQMSDVSIVRSICQPLRYKLYKS